jgi:2-C-methyl-D-erythritol 2,4-cyclodiphosphate synthase
MATAPSLFLGSSPISTAPRTRAGPAAFCPPSARPSLRLWQKPSPVVAAAVQAEHQPAVAAAPKPPALPFRVGHGFDLHRLEPDLPLIIGGINIPHDRGCEAHSDGNL